MKNYFVVCGKPIYYYENNQDENVYTLIVGNIIYRSLTICMLRKKIEEINDTWKSCGLRVVIVQDMAINSEIHVVPVHDINFRSFHTDKFMN